MHPMIGRPALRRADWWYRTYTASFELAALKRRFVAAAGPHTAVSADVKVELNARDFVAVRTRPGLVRAHDDRDGRLTHGDGFGGRPNMAAINGSVLTVLAVRGHYRPPGWAARLRCAAAPATRTAAPKAGRKASRRCGRPGG